MILVNAFTGIFTYYAMGKFTRKQNLKIIGTMLYMLCTYRLVNMNIRSAAGEYTAMCFLPLIVVGLYNIMKKEDITISDWFPLAAGMSGVLMSHIVTAEMLVINISILCIMSLTRLISFKRIIAMLKAVFSSVMMTAWFLIPFIDSAKNQTTIVQKEDLRMLGTTTQTWTSLFEVFASGHDAGNWISLGLPFVVGIMLLLYCLYSWKNTEHSNKKAKDKVLEFRILCLFSFMNILFVSKVFPWNRIQNYLGIEKIGHQLGTIQFAWRFLSIAAILISISVVVALDFISDNKRHIYRASVIIMVASIVVGCGFFYYSFYDYAAQAKWSNVVSYAGSDNLYFLEGTDATICNVSKCSVKEGNVDINGYKKENGKATLHVKNNSKEQEGKVSVPIFAYNHYHVYELQSKSVVKELEHDKDENNCILITIPAGFDGSMQISFVEPVLWRISEIISLLTWIIVSYMVIVKLRCRIKICSK